MQEVSTKYPGPLKTVKGFTIDEKEKYVLKTATCKKSRRYVFLTKFVEFIAQNKLNISGK